MLSEPEATRGSFALFPADVNVVTSRDAREVGYAITFVSPRVRARWKRSRFEKVRGRSSFAAH